MDLGVVPGLFIQRVTELRKSQSTPIETEFRSIAIDDRKITNTRLPNNLKYRAMFQGMPPALQNGPERISDPPH